MCVRVCQVEELEAGTPGRLKVTAKSTETDEILEGEYNTVCTDLSVTTVEYHGSDVSFCMECQSVQYYIDRKTF